MTAAPELDAQGCYLAIERGGRFLDLPVAPMAAPRPTVTRHGAYYPSSYTRWSKVLAALARLQLTINGISVTDGPMAVSFTFIVRHRRRRGAKPTRPDLSNYIKAVEDALQGIVWRDDAQIVWMRDCAKLYGNENRIIVRWWDVDGTRAPPAGA